jgi:serine phosphatase RsbU (regulator of sigma subunit)
MLAVETRGTSSLVARSVALPLLLVEDDDGDAFLVQELLTEAGVDWPLERVRNLADAVGPLKAGVRCVLLDLGLPDAQERADGLGALYGLLVIAPDAPVLVLTGLDDEDLGAAAVYAGAQDYLVKGQVNGQSLSRAVLYAVERRRAEESARQLREADLQQAEINRLTRGLLPQPQLLSSDLFVQSRYTPGERRQVLGGDFYDVVEEVSGTLHLLVGDVSGHGPDEAALGVHLRVAWRTLVLAGVASERVLAILEDILVRERRTDEIFATVCQLVVHADRRSAGLWLAGHPVPILLDPRCHPLAAEDFAGPPIGVAPGIGWERVHAVLPDGWALALHSDGLIEGFEDHAVSSVDTDPKLLEKRARLGLEGLLTIVRMAQAVVADDSELLDTVIDEAERRNGGPMADDLAVLLVRHRPQSS